MLQFNPKTGLYVDSVEVVREEVRGDWRGALGANLDVDAATPAGQLIDSETAMVADKDSQVLFLANQFNPAVNEGIWQDAIGYIYFLDRKIAEPTVVEIVSTGLAGTAVPAGALIQSGVEETQYFSLSPFTIPPNGSISTLFACVNTGPVPCAADTITKIVTVVPGWDTVNNPSAGAVGREVESQQEFEARRAASVARNAHGTVPALYGEIANIPGVLDVVVLENVANVPVVKWGVTIDPHSVYISVAGGTDQTIAQAINIKKDAGCGTTGNTPITYVDVEFFNATYIYNVERPAPLDFSIQVTLRLTPSTPATIEDDIKTALLANFSGLDGAGRVKIASTVYASRFYAPVIRAGVQDLVSVKIAAPVSGAWVDELTVTAEQLPVLSADDIFVSIAT